ncbi:MAG: type I restriction enzyme endonuclease domain-containing protein [Aquificaceae bacterium]
MEEGKKLNLTEEELAFYDLLLSKQEFFKNYDEIEKVAREIVKELGYYVKVADWNRKEYLKTKIRTALKNVLMKILNHSVQYEKIHQLSEEIVNHAEVMYSMA